MVLTQQEILYGIAALGVASGMMLEAHCSLGSFGMVQGGAAAVIGAIKDAVGTDGAILMPSFRHSPHLPLDERDRALGLTLKIRILHDDSEPSGMGTVADTFRKMPDTVTGQGPFRVSAWGKDAQRHADTGFRHLIDSDGYALLMGVDIYSMSSMHYVEDCLPQEIARRFAPSEEARRLYPEDEWLIEAWEPQTKPWYAIQNRAYERGFIRDRMIGGSKCMLVQVKNTVGLYRQALQEEPFKLYGLA